MSRWPTTVNWVVFVSLAILARWLFAAVGDPQLATNHPWYPGELACSTFARLQETQAELFLRSEGRRPESDEDRALAAWYWRNIHFAHGEQGAEDLWGRGFQNGDVTCREYWTGLFAHGFGLCGTTHAQWTAEFEHLLGHSRARTAGVAGHNACEVFLTGGVYGPGRWALLDHDISTVVFAPDGSRLLSIAEIRDDLRRLTDPRFQSARQRGWPLGGLHPDDPQAYSQFTTAEYLSGYAGPPPRVELRRGESLRRYFEPGLDDGRTFVFWGRNYDTEGVPGPERSRTWVNQPERFRSFPTGSGYRPGQARYGNAVYRYEPNFRDGTYREGLVEESDSHVTFQFTTPYIIAATPAGSGPWAIYQPGCRNGLVVSGEAGTAIALSVDRGRSWNQAKVADHPLDLTDFAKGHRQYWLRIARGARELGDAKLVITTVCQANPAVMPRLRDGGTELRCELGGRGTLSVGPNVSQVTPHVVEGKLGSPRVALEVAPLPGRPAVELFAAAHVASSNPPDPNVTYQIEYSLDRGRTYQPLVKDWRIERRGDEPADFWSQSFCYGHVALPQATDQPVRVRFRNSGGKAYLRTELHLGYQVPTPDNLAVTYCWSDDAGARRIAEHRCDSSATTAWTLPTGRDVRTHWVEFTTVPR